jgi:transcriptional regulator with XRE-family HTH domain
MNESAMGDFLAQTPGGGDAADVGLMDYGTRRVPGLRREEVAMLATMSVTYYARLEQGQHVNASDTVIDSLARALALTEVERKHLADLSGAKHRRAKTIRSRPDQVRPGTRRLMKQWAVSLQWCWANVLKSWPGTRRGTGWSLPT